MCKIVEFKPVEIERRWVVENIEADESGMGQALSKLTNEIAQLRQTGLSLLRTAGRCHAECNALRARCGVPYWSGRV